MACTRATDNITGSANTSKRKNVMDFLLSLVVATNGTNQTYNVQSKLHLKMLSKGTYTRGHLYTITSWTAIFRKFKMIFNDAICFSWKHSTEYSLISSHLLLFICVSFIFHFRFHLFVCMCFDVLWWKITQNTCFVLVLFPFAPSPSYCISKRTYAQRDPSKSNIWNYFQQKRKCQVVY